MYCPECGKQIPDSSKFCLHCGYKIENLNLKDEKRNIPKKEVTPQKTDNKIKENKNAFESHLVVLIGILAICAIVLVSVIISQKPNKNTEYSESTSFASGLIPAFVNQSSSITDTPVHTTEPTTIPINPIFNGTWRDQIYREGVEWIQYELIFDVEKDQFWINTISDAGRVKMTGPEHLALNGDDFILTSGGFKFTYDKENDTLTTDSKMFTPPFERYSDETKNTAFGANPDDYKAKKKSFSGTETDSKALLTNSEAFTVAQYIVKQELVSPSTAKFCKITEAECVFNSSTGKWTVRGWLDSQNEYGAMVRQNFTAVFKPVKDSSGNIGYKNGVALMF
ncbi:MAG: zinc-ribbon domain-containing protein [Enterococcus sp.]|uniref:zinc ribbon domain-containing protein n=1 Tax=Enterococcus sp. TaxID=35783 RepID=UPI00257EF4A6|nr:zinc ribbon domain-containing protein [Enterococcus sp.]MBR2525363.1 zinc-ribbon domain-containing protein [bacterium]MBR3047765.1 zinc-ribbon domain-containing protein [Enterococcus sp.]